jgi:hypothetical protein
VCAPLKDASLAEDFTANLQRQTAEALAWAWLR